jgi:hypothetical protein
MNNGAGPRVYTEDMMEFESHVDPGLMGPSAKVVISKRALKDLEGVGRLTRRFLERTVRDELLAPTDSSKIELLRIDGEATGLYKVGVGNFTAVFKPLRGSEDNQLNLGRANVVERILPAGEVDSVLAKQLADTEAVATATKASASS